MTEKARLHSLPKFKFNVEHQQSLADLLTPVAAYLRIRRSFPRTLLLEGSDSTGPQNSFSFLCVDPIATFSADTESVAISLPNLETITIKDRETTDSDAKGSVLDYLKLFRDLFSFCVEDTNIPNPQKAMSQGLFGYCTYDGVQFFEDIKLSQPTDPRFNIPLIRYSLFRYVVCIDHFRNQVHCFKNNLVSDQTNEAINQGTYNPSTNQDTSPSLQSLMELISTGELQEGTPFKTSGQEESNFTEDEYRSAIEQCKSHIMRGDVFQIVPSRRFVQGYSGDDFQLYRALRSINPSPYLYYFDYEDYRIFGSSPEAQIVIRKGEASIFPLAGTFRRTGDDKTDLELADKLKADPKENAEHVMLVDLARNDLSKHCDHVRVESFRETQFCSHVIHLVSKVTGKLNNPAASTDVIADTFPAGTLTGAPKYSAMQIIDRVERGARGFYGGCIGYLAQDGGCNQAIMIRSFLSKNNNLMYQAGAGIVADSSPASEVQEVTNKLMALKKAIAIASEI
jgi:anthranilate synthase component I